MDGRTQKLDGPDDANEEVAAHDRGLRDLLPSQILVRRYRLRLFKSRERLSALLQDASSRELLAEAYCR